MLTCICHNEDDMLLRGRPEMIVILQGTLFDAREQLDQYAFNQNVLLSKRINWL